MRTIPLKLRNELSIDPFYKRCCISRSQESITFHHNLIFAGSQVNEKFCILPLSKEVHDNIKKYKEKCDWIMWNRASSEQIKKYSRGTDYQRVLNNLNEKYGTYREK